MKKLHAIGHLHATCIELIYLGFHFQYAVEQRTLMCRAR